MRTRAQQGCGKAGAGWRVPEALVADDARPAGRVVQPCLVQLKAAARSREGQSSNEPQSLGRHLRTCP